MSMANRLSPANKDIVHECPICSGALATWAAQMNGGWHEIRVHAFYKQGTPGRPGQSSSGNRADGWQVGGYAKVHQGDRIYITYQGKQ